MMAKIFFLFLFCFYGLNNSMLVKDWGTNIDAKRLAWSTRSFFENVLELITLGQEGFYPIEGFMQRSMLVSSLNNKDRARIMFAAYNGWLKDLQLNVTNLNTYGRLRRFIMTSAEKHVHEKDTTHSALKEGGGHQHEIVFCESCLTLKANGFQFGYEATIDDPKSSSYGIVVQNDPLQFKISFHLVLMTSFNRTTGRRECSSELENFAVVKDENNWVTDSVLLHTRASSGTFSFLADTLKDWISTHINNTVTPKLESRILAFAESIMESRDFCAEFLTSGVFTKTNKNQCHYNS